MRDSGGGVPKIDGSSATGRAALGYVKRDLAVIPIKPGEKVPATKHGLKDYVDSTNPKNVEMLRRYYAKHATANVAIVCGEPSGGLMAIDLDCHGAVDGRDTLREWEVRNGGLPETWTVVTGSGGKHLLYRVRREMRPSANPDLGVDIRCDGSYIVAPPSIHPNGTPYEWSISPDDMELADANDAVYAFVDYVRPTKRERTSDGAGTGGRFELPEKISAGGRNNALFKYACSLRSHSRSEPEIRLLVEDANRTRCESPLPQAEIDKIVASACTKEPGNRLRRDENPEPSHEVEGFGAYILLPDEPAPKMRDETSEKILRILLGTPEVRECVKRNAMDGRIWVTGGMPGLKYERPHPLTDAEEAKVYTLMERAFGIRSRRKFGDALTAFTAEPSQQFSPLMDKIEALPKVRPLDGSTMAVGDWAAQDQVLVSLDGGATWEAQDRMMGRTFAQFLGGDFEDEYSYQAEILMYKQLVARAFRPGCKADVMAVLVGPQGVGKSTFCSLLALDPDFYLEGFSDFKTEDLKRILGKLVVEVPELDGFGKKDMNTVKSIITTRVDTYRESYGRNPADHPRMALFFGTTNDAQFLTDVTGNRRFLPIECRKLDAETLVRADPDLFNGEAERAVRQAWAEAVALRDEMGPAAFERSLVLPERVQKKAMEVQESYTVEDPMLVDVYTYMAETSRTVVTTKIVAQEALRYDENKWATEKSWVAAKIASALDRCEGWGREKSKKNVGGTKIRMWKREELLKGAAS